VPKKYASQRQALPSITFLCYLIYNQLIKVTEEGAQNHKDLVPGCLSWQMSEEINFMGTEQKGERSMILIQECVFQIFSLRFVKKGRGEIN
jgi:hypothetical protein